MDPYRCGFGPCGFGHGGGNRGWNWLGLVDSIALWLLLIAAILVVVALVRRAGGGRAAFSTRRMPAGVAPTGWASAAPPHVTPPHIMQAEATLADRFARGEISAEQYQDQLAVLRGYQPQQAAPASPTAATFSAPPPTAPPASTTPPAATTPPSTPPPGSDTNP